MINALFKYTFLQHAFAGIILASIVCGIIGTIIIEKKMVMMSGGIAHTAFGGIGFGYFCNFEPIIGGLCFSVLAALAIAYIHRKEGTDSEILIGMFWAFGMALGILFISFAPGYPPDITSYLFGDILTISKSEISLMIVVDIMVVFFVFGAFNLLKSYLFDEEFSAVLGMPIVFIENVLYITIAITVVALIRLAGIILVIALLTIPPAVVRYFSNNLKNIMIFSIVVGSIFCFGGLGLSYILNIPSGASIILVSVICFLIITILKKCITYKSRLWKKR